MKLTWLVFIQGTQRSLYVWFPFLMPQNADIHQSHESIALQIVLKSYNIVPTFSSSIELHGLPERLFVTFCTIPSASYITQPDNCYRCGWWCSINFSPIFAPVTFFIFQLHLRIRLRCSDVNCGSAILFYAGYCHLAGWASTKWRALLSPVSLHHFKIPLHNLCCFHMLLTSVVCIFLGTLCKVYFRVAWYIHSFLNWTGLPEGIKQILLHSFLFNQKIYQF